jgi:alkylhydroperoxidase family enzyme
VRRDLPEAHTRAWQHLAAPGAWWTGAERVAIAAEARAAAHCGLCRGRKASLSPGAVVGQHASPSDLPDAAVEAIHRITTDPGRLSRRWFDELAAQGLGDAAYVELVGVVSTLVSVDAFCRAIGVPPHPLPLPQPGEPTRVRPDDVSDQGAFVVMRSSGLPNVMRALSLVPAEVQNLRELSAVHYVGIEELISLGASGRALDRGQMELLAGRVSALRECFY